MRTWIMEIAVVVVGLAATLIVYQSMTGHLGNELSSMWTWFNTVWQG
ncbi:MAG: hypothetical protein ABF969_11470 [Sporolactobacillus sp.]